MQLQCGISERVATQKGLALLQTNEYNKDSFCPGSPEAARIQHRLRPYFLGRGDVGPMKERRKHSRVPINKQAWIYHFDESTSPVNLENCTIVDISESGACIQCSTCYQEGQPLAFTYQDLMENGLRPVVGVVMWNKRHSEQDYRHGVRFLGLSTQMLRKIQKRVGLMTQKGDGPV